MNAQGPLYLDAAAPAAGRRPHWAHVRVHGPCGGVLLPILLDNHLSTDQQRTTDEEHAAALALAQELVDAANMVRRLQAHPVLYRLICRYPDTVAALLDSLEALAAEELDR